MHIANEAAHRRSHVRRVLHEQADETEGMQPVVLTDQETEMRAAGPGRAMTQDAIANRVGDPSLRVIEQFQVVTQLGQHLLGIRAEAAKNVRYGHDAGHADNRGWWIVLRCCDLAYRVTRAVRFVDLGQEIGPNLSEIVKCVFAFAKSNPRIV